MPRIARIVGRGYPHHVVQRGNNREKVFLDKEDYPKYLHLLLRPLVDNALPKMMMITI
jgi:putative transposase